MKTAKKAFYTVVGTLFTVTSVGFTIRIIMHVVRRTGHAMDALNALLFAAAGAMIFCWVVWLVWRAQIRLKLRAAQRRQDWHQVRVLKDELMDCPALEVAMISGMAYITMIVGPTAITIILIVIAILRPSLLVEMARNLKNTKEDG